MGVEYIRTTRSADYLRPGSNIILYDDMEDLLKWDVSGYPVAGTVTKEPTATYNKNYGLRIATRATTPAINDYTAATRSIANITNNEITIELFFRLITTAANAKFDIRYDSFYNGLAITTGLRIDGSTNYIWLMNEGGGYVQTTLQIPTLSANYWHRLSVSFNLLTNTYIKAKINAINYNLTNYRYFIESGFDIEQTTIMLLMGTKAAAQATIDIDDCLIYTT
uniref:Putative lectin/glucanase superfamily protein n=3 Tax=viral metagenome TaxID=1070528 RepID=A0A6M3JP97_9ZZZZ